MAGRFLRMFRPIARFLPTISPPKRRVGFTEKLFWTFLVLALYLIMSEVPLYLPGIDPGSLWELSYTRIIFASRRGTLMELGIGPIVTAGLILQLLAGSGMIECDMSNPEDRATFTSASKAFSIIFTGIQASAYIIGGVYGRLAPITSIVIFLQLLAAGAVVILLDELLQKGWGIGSGISLFIMAGVAQTIVWDCFNPFPVEPGRGHGVFVALVQTLMAGGSPWEVFIRARNLPSLLGFFTTIVVFLIVIYFQAVRVELPISHATYRGYRSRYPIRLLYVSNLPVIFASALFANVYLFSQIFWYNFNRDGSNLWLNLLGRYETVSQNGRSAPQLVGGLAYYMIAPRGIMDVMNDPVRAFAYAAALIAFCAIFSMVWLEVGGLGPSTVAKQLVDSGMQIPGYRRSVRSIEMLLKRYIPAVTVLGGIIVGALAAFSDFLGAFGSGTGILLAVGILYQYYELLMQERVAEMYPAFRRFLGG